MAKKRKRRVPEVLWRLFHNRARTLADTILSFLPSPPPSQADCQCRGQRCLGCCGDKALSYLLRAKDPPDYRKLLTQSFVVVADNAPPFPGFDPSRQWDHLEIIRRSIEMIMLEQHTFSNIIYCGYDKRNRTSSIVELLASSAWRLLSKRVGDIVMVYLLKNTSLFIPLPQRKYFQVAGFPISSLCQQFLNNSFRSEDQPSLKSHLGHGKKRKLLDEVDRRKANIEGSRSAHLDFHSRSFSSLGSSERPYEFPSSRCCGKKCNQKTPCDGSAEADGGNVEVCNSEKFQENIIQAQKMPRKRKRQTSWQRRRKRKQLNSAATSSLIPHSETLVDSGNSCGMPPNGETTEPAEGVLVKEDICHRKDWKENISQSFGLSRKRLRQYSWQRRRKRVNLKSQVTSSLTSCSRKLSGKDVASSELLSGLDTQFSLCFEKEVFGSSDVLGSAESIPCLQHEHSVAQSMCLYHLLVKRLKSLIRKAQSCQYLRLLDKHCAVSSMDQFLNVDARVVTEGCESQRPARGNEYVGNGLTDDIPYGHDSGSCSRTLDVQSYQCEPSKFSCLKKQVISFIWAACRSIVPPDLLGSPSNWRILRKNIARFICLRRFEKFTLRQCMYKLKVSKYPLLSNKCSLCLGSNMPGCEKGLSSAKCKKNMKSHATDVMKHQILECWILWLFSQIVVPLVQTNFYVTESEHGNQEVYYFRRSIWEKLACKAFTGMRHESHFLLSMQSVRKIISGRSFGFSRIRLRPKENGFRVLANLKASSRLPGKFSFKLGTNIPTKLSSCPSHVKYDYFMSVNKVLSDVHGVLKGVQMTEPEKLGSSVFDYNDVYRKIVPFLFAFKNGSDAMPGVFVVVSDVSKAFDTVDQGKLLSVMDEVMSKDEYPLEKYLQVICTRKSLLVRKHQASLHGSIPGSLGVISTFLACAPSGIIVKEESSRKIRKEDLCLKLDEHIKRNVLQLGNKFCVQTVGIPQGSVLSSLLCSFYLGHLERKVIFPYLENANKAAVKFYSGQKSPDASDLGVACETETPVCGPKFLLLRFIDDFLFISTSRKQASLFFTRLKRGFRQYNCYMNEGKFGLNFNMEQISRIGSSRHIRGQDGILFLRWSGLLVNSSSLEIQADYTRYMNSHLSTSLTVSWHDRPGCLLKRKLCCFLRPKCHPLFYDSNINSAAIVRLNIYQAFLLCAMKFHCYICALNGISTLGIEFCMDAVLSSLRYMQNLIKRRMYSIRLDSGFRPKFEVPKEEIEWLGVTAYTRVLKRKESRYGDLVSRLRSKLKKHRVSESVSSAMEYAVDDSHSSLVWKIRY